MVGEQVLNALQEGYTLDEIRSFLFDRYKDAVNEGYSKEEINKFTKDNYGFIFTPDAETDEDIQFIGSILDNSSPEATQRQIDFESNLLTEKDSEAASISKALDVFYKQTTGAPDTSTKPTEIEMPPKVKRPPKQVETIGEALDYGFAHSNTGLFLNEPNSYMPDNPSFAQQLAAGIGQVIGDIPTYIVGGGMGAIAGAPLGPAGASASAFAGASALTEGVRKSLMLAYTNGAITTPEEFIDRTIDISLTAAPHAVIGAAAGAVGGAARAFGGRIPGMVAKPIAPGTVFGAQGVPIDMSASIAGRNAFLEQTGKSALSRLGTDVAATAAEVGVFTTGGAAVKGQLPNYEDFILGGVMIGGMKAAGFYSNKLMKVYTTWGLEPKSLVDWARINNGVAEDLISSNMAQPRELGGNEISVFLPRKNSGKTGTNGEWVHTSERVAKEVTATANKKGKVTDPSSPDAFTTEHLSIPAETQFLNIRSSRDPKITEIYSQFLKAMGLETPENLPKAAKEAFVNPSSDFIEFLKSGDANYLGKPIDNIQGISFGNRLFVFDKNALQPAKKIQALNDELTVTPEKIHNSISVLEKGSKPISRTADLAYESVVDRVQSLNKLADIGKQTVSYIMTRLYSGVDGLVLHWFELGTTVFSAPDMVTKTLPVRPINGPSLKSVLQQASHRYKSQASDELATPTIEKLNDTLRIGSKEERDLAIKAVENMHAAGEITANVARKTILDIQEMFQTKYSKKDPLYLFRTYIVAKRALSAAKNGIEISAKVDLAEAQKIVDSPAWQERFERASQELNAYTTALLKYRLDGGLISKRKFNAILKANPDYIPLKRIVDEASDTGVTYKHKLKGSDRDIVDPIESLIRATHQILKEVEYNSVKKTTAWQYGLEAKEAKAVATVKEIQTAKSASALESGKNVILSYKDNGVTKQVEVPKYASDALKNIDPVTASMYNPIVSLMTKHAGVLRAGAIFNPVFATKNPFRDQLAAYINSEHGFRAFFDIGKGLKPIISHATGKALFPKAEEHYSEWLRHGGANATLVSIDRQFSQKMWNHLAKSHNPQNSVPFSVVGLDAIKNIINPVNWAKGPYKMLQGISETTENMTRIADYVLARQQGISPSEAAYRAREVSMDFARIGATTRALNGMNAFLNAKIQGADRTVRQMMSHPARTMSRIVSGIIIPTLYLELVKSNYLLNEPDGPVAKALKEVPDWQEVTNWVIPAEMGVFKVPIPFDYGVPFVWPIKSFVKHMTEADPDKGLLERIFDPEYVSAVADQFFMTANSAIQAVVPNTLKWPVDTISNFNFFRGQPLVSPSLERELPSTRYNMYTSEIAKSVSRFLEKINPWRDEKLTGRFISPIALDHAVNSYAGGLGRDVLNLLDWGLQKAGVLKGVENQPAKKLSDIPYIQAFMIKYPTSSAKSIEEFHKQAEVLEQTRNSITKLMKEGTASSIDRAELLLIERDFANLTKINLAISRTNQLIRMVYYNPEIKPEQKTEQIDALYYDMIHIARGGLDVINAIKKQNKEMREKNANPK